MMFRCFPVLGALAVISVLPGCVTPLTGTPAVQASAETIAISVGPCFGFCPVYKMSVAPGGAIVFRGERHTALLGDKTREGGSPVYADAAGALAPYRPQTGSTVETTCDARISDQQNYRISWTAADGTVTALDHDKGCRSTRNDGLNAVLQDLPSRLGIEEWARQTSRPGASRG